MEQERATISEVDPSPVFAAYRRGYDPEQVDRYIADQRHRLDEANDRASEAERRLAAAVGQLRELHRRVAMLESEDRSQTPPLDMLGERVQRILQEAWEGAFQLRQAAEHDVAQQREESEREVTEMLESARRTVAEERTIAEREIAELLESGQRRAMLMRAETERRRQAYLEQIQDDREQAVGQISYLYDQRQSAVAELARLKATIEATVAEMARSPIGVPSVGSGAAMHRVSDVSRVSAVLPEDDLTSDRPARQPAPTAHPRIVGRTVRPDIGAPRTDPGADTELVRLLDPPPPVATRAHRAITAEHEALPAPREVNADPPPALRAHARRRSGPDLQSPSEPARTSPPPEGPSVFDFDDPQPVSGSD
jgi:hypothetical protein